MKKETDYSSTIIYKITCKDELVKDVYVGHTTDFVKRKYSHKQDSINGKCKLYAVIRANGGWDNWQMEIINFFNCKDLSEAKQREQEYFISLNATLNSVEPFPVREGKEKKKKIVKESVSETNISETNISETNISETNISETNISETNITTKNFCEKCNKDSDFKKHILTKKTQKFNCENCLFSTSNKKDYGKHLLTSKHLNIVEKCANIQKKHENPQVTHYACECGNIYKHNSGLWRHKKLCTGQIITTTTDNSNAEVKQLTTMVIEFMKSNSEIQKQMLELYKNNTL